MSKMVHYNHGGKVEEDLFKEQLNHLSSALLVDDYDPYLTVDTYDMLAATNVKFPNKGELISGSFMSAAFVKAIYRRVPFDAADIDIYFKSKEDAQSFIAINGMWGFEMDSEICGYGSQNSIKYNLIWGIDFKSPEHLVSRFDIRACAVAYNPHTNKLYAVRGALEDAMNKNIVFNPVPRAISVRRLVKYIEKGFTIEPHQRLFFAELVRSNIYSTEIELITGYK